MRLRLLGLVLSLSLCAALAAGCGNSVDPVANPTPTPTEETPTPTPGGQTGTYSVAATQPSQSCTSAEDLDGTGGNDVVGLVFNVPNVYIEVDGGDFTPDWGFSTNANFSVPDPEHGTITGNDWVANYTYCDYVYLSPLGVIIDRTTKHVATWSGTFTGDGVFVSTLTQKLRNAPGNQTANCGATETSGAVTNDMGGCTSTGVSWTINGDMN